MVVVPPPIMVLFIQKYNEHFYVENVFPFKVFQALNYCSSLINILLDNDMMNSSSLAQL